MNDARRSLVELRVLDGANLYFPRPAVKLTLDLSGLLGLDEGSARVVGLGLGMAAARPGRPDTGLRQRFAAKVVARIVRRIAAEAGTTRLAVRSRPTADLHRLVVAYPWRRRGKAESLGHGVAAVLDALPEGDVAAAVSRAADDVRRVEAGTAPVIRRPRVPVVAVTGTNGKTTTSRMIVRMAGTAGLVVGWSSTDGIYIDGIYIDGELIEAGDYSGPSGAGRVLDDPRVQIAVTETARGGILLRGLGVAHNDVSVVTNVSADHLGLNGVDTVDQLAEVKAVITRVTRPEGAVVLNGDDPRTFAMRLGSAARTVIFSRDPASPSLRSALNEGGRAVTVIDGDITVLDPYGDPDVLLPVVDVPMTLSGLSHCNVENALAAVGAGLAVGLPRAAVIEGLRSFRPGPEDNPGRMNVYSLGGVTVVVDLAHNEAGVAALLEVLRGLHPPGAACVSCSVWPVTAPMTSCGPSVSWAPAARTASSSRTRSSTCAAAIGPTSRIFSARVLLRSGSRMFRRSRPSWLPCMHWSTRPDCRTSSASCVMCHAERPALDAWLRHDGATVDGPDQIRAKVLAAAAGRSWP